MSDPDIGPTTVVSQSARIASRVIEGQAVVIVIDEQTLHTLNEVGTFVWSELDDGERLVEDVVAATVREFEVTEDLATKDVLSFLRELVSLGALESR